MIPMIKITNAKILTIEQLAFSISNMRSKANIPTRSPMRM